MNSVGRHAKFTLRLGNGTFWSGNVHGEGGDIAGVDARARMEKLILRANAGQRLVGVVEPRRGHVRGYQSTALSDEGEQNIDIRGAELVQVEL